MLYLKALHIIFVVTWFAGLFYLPRLFIYHCGASDATSIERFKTMERRLFAITTIGGAGALVFGLWLTFAYAWQAYASAIWLHLKFALVALLIAFHLYLGKLTRDFRYDRILHGERFYRWLNEFPSLVLVAVVILAVAKPF
jgi:putative membrane protein